MVIHKLWYCGKKQAKFFSFMGRKNVVIFNLITIIAKDIGG